MGNKPQPGSMADLLNSQVGQPKSKGINLPNPFRWATRPQRDVGSPDFYYGPNPRGFGHPNAPVPVLKPPPRPGGMSYENRDTLGLPVPKGTIGNRGSYRLPNPATPRAPIARALNIAGPGRHPNVGAPVAPSSGSGRRGAGAVSPVQQPTGIHPVVSAIGQARNQQHQATISQGQQQGQVDDPYAGINDRAANAADLELTPQEQALQRQAQLDDSQYRYEAAKGQADTNRTVNEQQALYGRLNGQLNGQLPQIGGNYDDAGSRVKSLYDNLQGSIGQQYGNGINATTQEVQRLGLDPALPQATGQMTADSAFLKQLAGSDSAVQQGTIGNEKANALRDALANIATQAGQGTALTGNTLRDFNTSSNDSKFASGRHIADLLGQAASLEGTRKGITSENVNKLRGLADQSRASAAQQQFDNNITLQKTNNQTALAQAQVLDTKSKSQVAQATASKTLAEKQQILANMTPGSPAYEKLQADIAKANADAAASISNASTNLKNANTNEYRATHPNKTAGSQGKGLAGSADYLNQSIGSIDPNIAVNTAQLVNKVYNAHPPVNDKNQNDANYAAALHEARQRINARTPDQRVRNAVDVAVGLAYGK